MQAEIQPPIVHLGLPLQLIPLRQRCQRTLSGQPLLQSFAHQLIRTGGVDAGAPAPGDFYPFPAVAQFALGVSTVAQPHAAARFGAVQHGAGIGAVSRHFATIVQPHIGEKALVTLQ